MKFSQVDLAEAYLKQVRIRARSGADVAIRVLEYLALGSAETSLVHEAANEIGSITTQLAVARGANVIASVSTNQFELIERLGAKPIRLGGGLAERVRAVAPRGIEPRLTRSIMACWTRRLDLSKSPVASRRSPTGAH